MPRGRMASGRVTVKLHPPSRPLVQPSALPPCFPQHPGQLSADPASDFTAFAWPVPWNQGDCRETRCMSEDPPHLLTSLVPSYDADLGISWLDLSSKLSWAPVQRLQAGPRHSELSRSFCMPRRSKSASQRCNGITFWLLPRSAIKPPRCIAECKLVAKPIRCRNKTDAIYHGVSRSRKP